MNNSEPIYDRGDSFCRPADLVDVAKFFLLNYGLHAVTVLPDPGSTVLASILSAFSSILMPAIGRNHALQEISQFAFLGDSNLDVALRAGALCMLVPAHPAGVSGDGGRTISEGDEPVADPTTSSGTTESTTNPNTRRFDPGDLIKTFSPVSLMMTQVHGQFPKDIRAPSIPVSSDAERSLLSPEGPSAEHYSLVVVPDHFKVRPFLKPTSEEISFYRRFLSRFKAPKPGQIDSPDVSSSLSFVKGIAAIFQVLYGSYELYRAGQGDIYRFGYGAYQLTVIPYVLMSLVNLCAGLTAPRYSSRFLVHYRGLKPPGPGEAELYPDGWWTKDRRLSVEGKTSGVVGAVYGAFKVVPKNKVASRFVWPDLGPPVVGRRREVMTKRFYFLLTAFLCGSIAYGIFLGPYIVIYLLTGFKPGSSSTLSQRVWLMCWFVLGQTAGAFVSSIMDLMLGAARCKSLFAKHTKTFIAIRTAIIVLLSIPTFGGFVVVAQMILQDKTCERL